MSKCEMSKDSIVEYTQRFDELKESLRLVTVGWGRAARLVPIIIQTEDALWPMTIRQVILTSVAGWYPQTAQTKSGAEAPLMFFDN